MPPDSRAPIRPIIAATEGSPHGDYAVGVARQIAAAVGAEVVVLRVVAPGAVPESFTAVGSGTGGVTAAVADRVRVEVLVGYPSVEIVRYAERMDAGLLVLGRRPSAELGGAMLGPTADQVVRRSSVPCLVIPEGSWRAHPRILAAVDGTDRGASVLRAAVRVAELCEGSTRAVTVFSASGVGDIGSMTDPQVGDRVRRIAAQRTDRGRRGGDARPGPPVLVRHGDPVEEVLAEAGEAVDIVAVGMRRLGPPDSNLEQGIARRILRRATGVVLTIPL